jgi:hypothetical protein
VIKISDRQSTLFDLDQYENNDPVKWGWLEPEDEKLGSNKNLLPNSQSQKLGSNKNLLPNSKIGEQTPSDILLPNQPVGEQNNKSLSNLQIVKVKGRNYFLTPNKKFHLLPAQTTWYDIKVTKGHEYLYLRWREDKTQRSRCLGRLDALKYSD